MAELATDHSNRSKLVAGKTLVDAAMVTRLELLIDELSARFTPPTEFVVPGQTELGARLDVARTVVRRAERTAIAPAVHGSLVLVYLNRLSDLLWTMARWQEGDATLPARPD